MMFLLEEARRIPSQNSSPERLRTRGAKEQVENHYRDTPYLVHVTPP